MMEVFRVMRVAMQRSLVNSGADYHIKREGERSGADRDLGNCACID